MKTMKSPQQPYHIENRTTEKGLEPGQRQAAPLPAASISILQFICFHLYDSNGLPHIGNSNQAYALHLLHLIRAYLWQHTGGKTQLAASFTRWPAWDTALTSPDRPTSPNISIFESTGLSL